MTLAHKEAYENHDIEIHYDNDGENPRDWVNLGTMICFHSRYILGDEQPRETPQDFLFGLSEIDVDYWWEYYEEQGKLSPQEIDVKIQEKMKKDIWDNYIILPLNLYDHSGISMSTSSFVGRAHHAEWDSGQVGWIYVSKDDVKKEYGWKVLTKKRREQIEKYLAREVSIYDSYLRGDVYGYRIEGDLSNDSCWGFYPDGVGTGYAVCLKEAKGVIDWEVIQKEIADAHEEIEASESAWRKLAQVPIGAC